MKTTLPVYRPVLPPVESLLPYLAGLDASRIYTNRGTLNEQLESRLALLLAGRAETLVTAASGTAALQAAILAHAGRPRGGRTLALIPGYTFVATAFAALAAGYEPLFCDLAPASWRLRPDDLPPGLHTERLGLVLPVAPFGEMPLQDDWSAFQARTGIPVVIDAAASFEAALAAPGAAVGAVPVALSFHATKSFSTGEGGAVLWADREGLVRAAQAMNFGMIYTRESRTAGFNGKLSEYHAAIGLAWLDGLDQRITARRRVAADYRAAAAAHGLADRLILPPEIASCYALFRADTGAEADAVAAALAAAGIETRRWYGLGVQAESYFRAHGAAPLPETERLAARILGLPIAEDIGAADIARILRTLATGDAHE
ncbi:MAG TPA: DegT/DnrJ/EryC1/StrS family aminotransferase [Acidiphilium sp.]|uniref:DegT/DnrJ/EryC1/StrS family aminotransferase n=1 Tax=unclassified Acidiphilium TaxID=2617493 RepID=UPI0025B9125B|nr:MULTISPECIES: DegT/DnrJ/EryC1/StrS family aminotransferase [unclassified Acidiphilium]HQT62238.1 DegT/DnrJ/EryC1/StrS family aminotransferase [Acidiphilium sp.]HQU11274.1 DegT/DnrJ/EryC1/StrS family aminotransferase [Acidiphilium sp.]